MLNKEEGLPGLLSGSLGENTMDFDMLTYICAV